MEVVTASPSPAGAGAIPPYQRRDVEEWSHLDHLTGMLEHARVETDHWAANTHNSQHKYGKVVDSRDRSNPDGSQKQRQRRQLEVFQAHVPGGSLQVIRTQTVATSSSRWSSTSTSHSSGATNRQATASPKGFENLQLALNPLDLSSQKTKASVGRSGSIGGRRPPSRPRSIIGQSQPTKEEVTASTRLQQVSRLCQRLHKDAVTNPQNNLTNAESVNNTNPTRLSIHDRQNGDGSVSSDLFENTETLNGRKSPKNTLEDFWNKSTANRQSQFNASLSKNTWGKFSSNKFDTISSDNWRKSSIDHKPLQSIEFSNSDNSPSINKLKPDKETDRRLNTVLRGNNLDLEALDQILKSISSSTSSYSDVNSYSDEIKSDEQPEQDEAKVLNKNKKRHSFITVESLQEVRGRLRRLSSPIDEYKFNDETTNDEEPDDGIVAEDTLIRKEECTMPVSNAGVSRVRSYVYGMEAMLHSNTSNINTNSNSNNNNNSGISSNSNKKTIIGTGSLESRSSNKSNGNSTNRSEDWYNRRKSYGFEQVHNQQLDQSNSISLRNKNKIESSTDSGICRSTEIVVVPSTLKQTDENEDTNSKLLKIVNTSYGKIGNSTVINLNGDNSKSNNVLSNNELFNVWNRRSVLHSDGKISNKDKEQITITIPIVSDDKSSGKRLYHRQISDGTSMSIESAWSDNHKQIETQEVKRHSIAVDESKYVSTQGLSKFTLTQPRRISLTVAEPSVKDESQNNPLYDHEDDTNVNNFGKKQKKVEFCKTEVHFAAESGRVNIVETDEKPPPTQNFRRRRRNSSVTSNHTPEDYNKTGLPLIHFGDTTYEKKLFGISDPETGIINEPPESIYGKTSVYPTLFQENTNNVTVSSVSINQEYEPEKEIAENDNQPRGILKNKMIKPKPYILGDENNELLSQETPSTSDQHENNTIWGVRLRPVHKQDETVSVPIWRSTVTVQNMSYNSINNNRDSFSENEDKEVTSNIQQKEFQKLRHSLRPTRKSEPYIFSPEKSIGTNTSMDHRRSSWSVADRIKQVEDLKQEHKGYSTRVNFGSGETTIVENGDINKHTTWPRQEELHIKDLSSVKTPITSNAQKKSFSQLVSPKDTDTKVTSMKGSNFEKKSSDSSITESPKLVQKINSNIKANFELEGTPYLNGYLSSPSLVGNSTQKSSVINQSNILENKFNSKTKHFPIKESSIDKGQNLTKKSLFTQPIFSKELTAKKTETNNYFHHSKSPSLINTYDKQQRSVNKINLLKSHDNNNDDDNNDDDNNDDDNNKRNVGDNHKKYVNLSTVIKEKSKTSVTSSFSNKSKLADIKKVSSTKSHIRPDSPSVTRPESPIYENIDEVISNLNAMEKESVMLQELTKAADQILQAVNGYTDDDSKQSTGSEDEGNKHRLKLRKSKDLSTISETKFWKQCQTKTAKQISKNVINNKSKVRPTSSTSSIESLSKESKPVPPVRLNRAAKLNEEKTKKKLTGSNSELSKLTKARRLQRASSREALLQSHGSSSEDIATNIETRKPRLIRKSKLQTSATEESTRKLSPLSNSTNTAKKKIPDNRRSSDRSIVTSGLQEIRHKTAVSTIKSTAEKAAIKALKAKVDEQKKKTTNSKRDVGGSKGTNLMSSSLHQSGTGSTHRSSTTGTSRSENQGLLLMSTTNSHLYPQQLQPHSGTAVRTSSGVPTKKK